MGKIQNIKSLSSYLKIILLSLLLVAGCSQEQDEVQIIISETGEQWVPDEREGVFDVTSKKIKSRTYILTGETDNLNAREELVSQLSNKGFQVWDSIRILPYDLPYHWGLVTLSVASLRTEPSHSAEMSNQALLGTPVKILKQNDDWFYIQTPDRYLAWCEKGALVSLNDHELELWKNSQRVIVTKTQDYITEPTGNRRVCDVVAGCILEKISEDNGNITISLPDNRIGVLSKESVLDFNDWLSRPLPDSAKLVETALSMLGTPYLWGANSTKTLDCSGFTKLIYFLNGVILARDASLQALDGRVIESGYKAYKTGDLLFFGKPGHITHVAMYIGNAEYIHAAGRVKINSLDATSQIYNEYRANSFQKACRIIDSELANGIIPVKDHPWY